MFVFYNSLYCSFLPERFVLLYLQVFFAETSHDVVANAFSKPVLIIGFV